MLPILRDEVDSFVKIYALKYTVVSVFLGFIDVYYIYIKVFTWRGLFIMFFDYLLSIEKCNYDGLANISEYFKVILHSRQPFCTSTWWGDINLTQIYLIRISEKPRAFFQMAFLYFAMCLTLNFPSMWSAPCVQFKSTLRAQVDNCNYSTTESASAC